MKKVLSVLCILMLCLTASAQKKSSGKSSGKKATTTATTGGSSVSRASSAISHKKGSFALTADFGYTGGSQSWSWQAGNGMNTLTQPNNTTISFMVGADYFVLDNLEVGLGLGYANQRSRARPNVDAFGNALYQNIGLFTIAPNVGYHFPLCSWLHYVPKLEFSIGFGSNTTDIAVQPQQLKQTGTSNQFTINLALVNFEILVNKNVSLTLNLGGFSYDSLKLNNVPNPNGAVDAAGNVILATQTQTNIGFNLINGGFFGARIYF